MADYATSLFARLPIEVRERIYKYYLAPTAASFRDAPPTHFVKTDLEADAYYSTPLPALMLASKSFYRELRALVNEQAVLRIGTVGLLNDEFWNEFYVVGFAAQGPFRYDRLRTLAFVIDLRFWNYGSWLDFFENVMKAAVNLEKLTIDWHFLDMVGVLNRVGAATPMDEVIYAIEIRAYDGLKHILVSRQNLAVINLYGNFCTSWVQTLRDGTKARVLCYPERWWRESAEDSAAYPPAL
ncbi:hypothetical protein GGR57DRAFT_507147 [Xylariaceae sp. FL1272]|nr:hypothetical protein GGR57DRAFT_507147 [Xylariaceae sp. FL1272]